MSTYPASERAAMQRLQWQVLTLGIVALAFCVIGASLSPTQFFRSYLAVYTFVLGIPLGCLAILMLYYLTGGAWGFLIRRILEAATRTLPLLAVMFIPIGIGAAHLYLWAQPDLVAADRNLQHKETYLNVPFFWARAVLYFVCWIGCAALLNYWSRRQDQSDDPRVPRYCQRLSGPGLVIYGITITFASVDWVMSLQPTFHSSIFGPYFAAGEVVSAHAFAVIVLAWLASRPPFVEQISTRVLNDLGNLLFTFLIIWAYMAWFQFMLVWIANLPTDVIWYTTRLRGGWQWVAWALVTLHFAVPFFLLLMRDIKQNPRTLAQVAGLILFMQLVDCDYRVLPAFAGTTIAEHWMDFLMPLGLGGIWLAFFLWQFQRNTPLPRHDHNAHELLRLRRSDEEEAAREEALHHG